MADRSVLREPTRPPKERIPLPGDQSLGEEIANAVTHGIGAGLAIAGLVVLVVLAARRGDPWRIVGFSVYGATLILLYLVSTLYHGFTHAGTKRLFRLLDHAAIFLLIAGTYTPVVLIVMRGAWGWTLFGAIWALAISGVLFKVLAIGRLEWLAIAMYVAMGWLAVAAIRPMLRVVPPGLLLWLLIGGASYTLGLVFYGLKRVPFSHAVWHLFVLGGSVCHFIGLLRYAV